MILDIDIGTLVIAKRPFLQCQIGAFGVCYERYHLGNTPGWSFIFENGDYDGFSADDVRFALYLPDAHSQHLAHYNFRNVVQLQKDFDGGVFELAFAQARDLDPGLVFPAHKGRVS